MQRQLNIAVLVTDTTCATIEQKHGNMFTMFKNAFEQAAANHSDMVKVNATFEAFDVVNDSSRYPTKSELDAGKYDGIIITGSLKTAYHDDPWILALVKFIQDLQQPYPQKETTCALSMNDGDNNQAPAIRFKVPLLGVCFGHQIIARACGGVCERNPSGWEFGPTVVRFTEEGQRYLQTGNKTSMRINQFHSDHVPYLPPGFVRLATTEPHTSIQAMMSTDGRCITSQGHPEINCGATAMYLDHLSHELTPELIKDTRLRFDTEAHKMDSRWFADRLLQFFLGHLPVPSLTSPFPCSSSSLDTLLFNHPMEEEQIVPTLIPLN